MTACQSGDVSIVKELLDSGLDPNGVDNVRIVLLTSIILKLAFNIYCLLRDGLCFCICIIFVQKFCFKMYFRHKKKITSNNSVNLCSVSAEISLFATLIEPEHDKAYKMTYVPSKD